MDDEPANKHDLTGRLPPHLLAELAGMSAELSLLTALVKRQDGTLSELLAEVRALRAEMDPKP
jgi:hypothetical protein